MPWDVRWWGVGEETGLGSEVRSPSSWGTFDKHPHSPLTERGAGPAAHLSGIGKPGHVTVCVASEVASPQVEGLAG